MQPDDEDTNPVRLPHEPSPFDIGDRTIFQMRSQRFDVEDFGTVMGVAREDSVVHTATEYASDPLERFEQKLDAALRALETLQLRVDSLDSLLSRVVNR